MVLADREAFIAIIAPIGVNVDQVVSVISEKCRQINYDPNVIKLTDSLKKFNRVPKKFDSEFDRYKSFISAGDKICVDAKRGDILSLLAVAELIGSSSADQRKAMIGARRINIFRQIKRLEEYRHLERTYGRNIIFVGCYASKDDRVNFLVDKMRSADRGSSKNKLESQALDIISIDEDEDGQRFGQKIIECYPKSDFVIDCSSLKSLEDSCERLFQIYFGHPFVSPNRDEYASYIANAAAYRSLDLSRQVGAAIFSDFGEVISLGCNEVPAPGGGTYWCNDEHDARDYVLGFDSNQRVKEDMARDALFKLRKSGWLDEEKTGDMSLPELAQKVFSRRSYDPDEEEGPWRTSMLSDIIEYGRMVHAEMNALTDAARFRRSTHGATLYCTTMPCHMCTKLIIAAGIKRVVYVQPYVKSLAGELFQDSVVFDQDEDDASKVRFVTLKGVTPTGFKRAFAKSERRKEDNGAAKVWDKKQARPNFLTTIPYYKDTEIESLVELQRNDLQEITAIKGNL